MLLLLLLPPLLLALAPAPSAAVVVQSLDGAGWTVSNSSGEWPARVPGGVYTDLREAGVLDSDFFYDRNDENFRWVSYVNWTYTVRFEVSEEVMAKDNVQLVLHGVDTVATVSLNDQVLGTTDNMFQRYVFPAKAALATRNVLSVAFESAPAEAQRRFDEHVKQRGYAVPPDCLPDEYHGECHANHLRKMQASFAWDWGPAFPGSGIWKSVALEAFSNGSAVVRSLAPRYEPPSGSKPALLSVRVFLEAGAEHSAVDGSLSVSLDTGPKGIIVDSQNVSCIADANRECEVELTLTFDEEPTALLWWPNGEGEQMLFPLTATFTSASTGEESERTENVGLRTVELVQDPIDPNDKSKGLTFYFVVNGRPIFAKGSNWIPANVLPELGYEDATVRRLLEAARDAHMNMLRVWGGGVYESDLFYELADQFGLLIWQDMMFACAMYPAEEAFLASVREEVRQQVLRLAPRPSVAVWAGNNENEGALVDNWYGTSLNFSLYKKDYVKLYAETIRPLVLDLDPSRPFVTSSPSNGKATDEAGFVSDRPSNPLYGDVHYYNYLADGWNADTYEIPRFASEYGFQALPAVATLRTAVASPQDLAVGSQLLLSRQHHPNGYSEMANLVAKRFNLPDNWKQPEGFVAFTYLNEMYQAVAIQTQTEHYRRLRSQTMSDGRGRCMGALYWQLGDVWAAPTWASIDFAGRWKPLHHLATDFFSPVMASAYVNTAGDLHVWALNDRQEHVMSVVLQGRAGRWDTLQPEKWTNLTAPFTLAAAGSQAVLSEGVKALLERQADCGDRVARCFLLLRLVALPDGVQLGPIREVLPVPPKDAVGILLPNITVTEVTDALEVRLSASAPAPFVWLEAASIPGRFERNAFLMADAEARVRFLPAAAERPSAAQLRQALTVSSLASHMPASSTASSDNLRASLGYVARLPSVVLAASAGEAPSNPAAANQCCFQSCDIDC